MLRNLEGYLISPDLWHSSTNLAGICALEEVGVR